MSVLIGPSAASSVSRVFGARSFRKSSWISVDHEHCEKGKGKVHERLFEWGVGNRWRQLNRNRFSPVHKRKPKNISLRDNYYESPDGGRNIAWDNLNEAWEVSSFQKFPRVNWFEYEKLQGKPFPVKKYGVERAKEEAVAFFEELKSLGRVHARPERPEVQTEEGVQWDERTQSWMVKFWQDGRPKTLGFSADRHGFNQAKEKAILTRTRSLSSFFSKNIKENIGLKT